MSDLVGKTLGPYKLEATLGKGGMAMVYRAYQASVKRYVAIKVMAAEIADQPGFVERFEREAEVIASLEHPHILPVIDYGNADGVHYLVMRYIEGGSLEDRMRRKPLSLGECSRLLGQMASALDYAHKHGVVHRDLKPNNVLLDSAENAYLTDFGIARLAQSEHKLTATGSVMGTPAYMSPEQALGRPVDARSDIYTLGVVLYEMVLNKLPFAGDTPAALIFQHVYEQPTPPRQIRPDLPDSIALVLNRAMAKNPDERFQSAMELADAFADAVAGRAPSPAQASQEDMTNTVIGGPISPTTSGSGTPPPTPGQTDTPAPAPASTPAPTAAAAAPSAVTPAAATASARSGLSSVLVVVAVLVVLAIAGGGFLFINNTNVTNANNTGTAVAAANSTGTMVAILALSATATPTATLPPTATPTATATPTFTPTTNGTLTAVAAQMSTLNAFQANQTATHVAQIMATATFISAMAQTQAVIATQTQQGIAKATSDAMIAQTATAVAGATQTTIASYTDTPTPTRRPTATRRPTVTRTPTAAPNNGSGSAQDVVAQLRASGQLTGTGGKVALQADSVEVTVDKPGFDRWNRIDTSVQVTDFVMSAEIAWEGTDTGNQCGLLIRYSAPGDDVQKSTFYTVTISRSGTYQAYARDNTGYRDSPLIQKSSKLIQPDETATNTLLVIAQGNRFKLFINGQLADSFSDPAYRSGNVGVMASRPQSSSGLTCKFKNVWAYSLGATSQAGGDMTSANPDDVIAALVSAGIVPSGGRLVIQDPPTQLNVNSADPLFRSSDPISKVEFTNFVLSTDITSTGSADQTGTACGVYYNGQDVPDNWIVIFYTRRQTYSMYVRKAGEWAKSPTSTGDDQAIKGGVGDTNRLTLVVINNKATLYINGTKIFEARETSFPNGVLGYYMEKAKGQSSETCSYSNTFVWRLP